MHYKDSYCIIHLHSQDVDHDINDLQISIRDFPVYLVNTSNYYDWGLDKNNYCRDFLITYEHSAQALEHFEYIVKLTGLRGYNARRYIILLRDDGIKFWELFNSTALHYVRDTLVILPKKQHSEGIMPDSQGYQSFLLFTHKFVGIDNNQQPIVLDTWYSSNQSFQNLNGWHKVVANDGRNYGLFPDKVTNLLGRSIDSPFINSPPYTFSTLELGSEYNLIKFFLWKYNMTYTDSMNLTNIEGDTETLGLAYMNWTGHGIRGALLSDNPEESVDMTYGGNIGGEIADMLYDMVTIVHYGVTAIVPVPHKQHGWTTVLNTFKIPLWILYATAYFCLFLLISIPAKLENYCHKVKKPTLIAYYGLIFNQPLLYTKYHTGMSSRLLCTLVVPVYTDNVETVKDLAKSDLILISTVNFFELILNDERPLYRKLYDQVFYTTDVNFAAELFAAEKYAFGIIKYDTGFITSFCVNLFEQENVHHYQILKDDVLKWNTYIVLRKHSVFAPQFELVVERAREAGLLLFWKFQIFLAYSVTLIVMKLKDENAFNPGVFKLQLMHLKGAFGVLFFGLAIACIAFLYEMFPFIR